MSRASLTGITNLMSYGLVCSYWRTINYGIAKAFRHKSGVNCDFRLRPRNFSETTWIYPKEGKRLHTSSLFTERLVDVKWYKSGVDFERTNSADPDDENSQSECWSTKTDLSECQNEEMIQSDTSEHTDQPMNGDECTPVSTVKRNEINNNSLEKFSNGDYDDDDERNFSDDSHGDSGSC